MLQNELCQQTIAPELAIMATPTANSSQEEIRAYSGYLQTNHAMHLACYM
jgi:hypothetical protein